MHPANLTPVRLAAVPIAGARGQSSAYPRVRAAGFTLIELLTVIAIIGILAAILIPTTSSARMAAKKAKTRGQFAQWGAAIEAFRQEYGYYPTFENRGAGQNKVNGNTSGGTNLAATHLFYEVLVGTRRNGAVLPNATSGNPPPAQAQNTRRISFITFTDSDIVPVNTTESALLTRRGLIRDAFDNTDIAVLVDRNLDGSIRYGGAGGDQIASLPFVSPPDANVRLQPLAADFPATSGPTGGGVRAGVVFYCAPPGLRAGDQGQLILSWK